MGQHHEASFEPTFGLEKLGWSMVSHLLRCVQASEAKRVITDHAGTLGLVGPSQMP